MSFLNSPTTVLILIITFTSINIYIYFTSKIEGVASIFLAHHPKRNQPTEHDKLIRRLITEGFQNFNKTPPNHRMKIIDVDLEGLYDLIPAYIESLREDLLPENRLVTVVVTACHEFDEFVRTMESFFANNNYKKIAGIIVTNNCLNETANVELLKRYLNRSDIIYPSSIARLAGRRTTKDTKIVQSVVKAYKLVETPWIFHMEDDFILTQNGFIDGSFAFYEKVLRNFDALVESKKPIDVEHVMFSKVVCHQFELYTAFRGQEKLASNGDSIWLAKYKWVWGAFSLNTGLLPKFVKRVMLEQMTTNAVGEMAKSTAMQKHLWRVGCVDNTSCNHFRSR